MPYKASHDVLANWASSNSLFGPNTIWRKLKFKFLIHFVVSQIDGGKLTVGELMGHCRKIALNLILSILFQFTVCFDIVETPYNQILCRKIPNTFNVHWCHENWKKTTKYTKTPREIYDAMNDPLMRERKTNGWVRNTQTPFKKCKAIIKINKYISIVNLWQNYTSFRLFINIKWNPAEPSDVLKNKYSAQINRCSQKANSDNNYYGGLAPQIRFLAACTKYIAFAHKRTDHCTKITSYVR